MLLQVSGLRVRVLERTVIRYPRAAVRMTRAARLHRGAISQTARDALRCADLDTSACRTPAHPHGYAHRKSGLAGKLEGGRLANRETKISCLYRRAYHLVTFRVHPGTCWGWFA